jgi:class 3 adenylate cyclase
MGERSEIPASQPASAGERRQVSVLFTDMVGYTAIVDKLGEEKALHFTRMVYERLTATVEKHGGTVRSFAGDSIMGVFGIPEALEDAALRSCRAGLAIHAAFASAAQDIETQFGVRPSMRVGVSSGSAMMASVEGENSPITAVGNTVNMASRIQGLAPSGGCLICDTTRRLVEWRVDLGFHGEHEIKGVTRPQKLWQLMSIRDAATRFDASRARGLSTHIGRDAELSDLSDAMARARNQLCVADIVAEPGLGKTRLAYEFLHGAAVEDATVLTGQCSADGQNVPFLPFIEVVRGSFRIRAQDEPAEISRKLEKGLQQAGLHSRENLGLLLNLLGLSPPSGAFEGLDGVLIGLRTRDLLWALLDAQCASGLVILHLEDIHWIDRASEEMLRKLIEGGARHNLLIIHTRRPEYSPDWCANPRVISLALKPLSAAHIRSLAQAQLAIDEVPDELIEQMTERAGGNPLYAEEILSFLIETGTLRITAGRAEFDAALGNTALPESMQSLFAARVDQLKPQDRAVLQAAAAIGRRFDPALVSTVVEQPDEIGAALRRLEALDIVYREAGSSGFVFKHVLMRDSVYHSLLSERRTHLHTAIAEALEKRNDNRLSEAAEILAFHYALTGHTDRAFTYHALAGTKSVGVFSLDEANRYFAAALDLYRNDTSCASDGQFSELVANYALSLNISLQVRSMLDLADDVGPILARFGDSHHHVVFLHHNVASMIWNGRYRDAWEVQQDLTDMAERLGDPYAKAYAGVSELALSNYHRPFSNEAYAAKRQAIDAALAEVDDAYLRNYYIAHVGHNEVTRGRMVRAREIADSLTAAGQSRNDPRSTGYGIAMSGLIAMVGNDHETALRLADEAYRVSKAEFERAIAGATRYVAIVALGMPGATEETRRWVADCEGKGWILFGSAPDMMVGVGQVMTGRIDAGLAHIHQVIARRESEGFQNTADWNKLFLAEIYLEILSGGGKARPGVVLRNIRSVSGVLMFGAKRIEALIERVRANPHFDPDGFHIARAEMILGLLHKHKKRKALALRHLTDARRIMERSGDSPVLTRVNAALAEISGHAQPG